MPTIRFLVLALMLFVVGGPGSAIGEEVNSDARTRDVLIMLEKSGFQAWKSKDAMFWDSFLDENYVGFGRSGRLDKASAATYFQGMDCEIKSFELSDEVVRMLGHDVALLTYEATVDGACSGKAVPAHTRAASAYVRRGEQWKAVFHSESSIVDPGAATAKTQAPAIASEAAQPATQNPDTAGMLAVEKLVWEDWRKHDTKRLAKLMTKDSSFINIFGAYFPSKAAALKDWSGAGCDIKRIRFSDAKGVTLSQSVGLLTFNANIDGTCYGQVPPPIWGSTFYLKTGETWKWTFGINSPAQQ